MEPLRTECCVVGAGFAGLSAARRLKQGGKSIVLLEARDRVGGRVWNRKAEDGTVASVGGTWLGKGQDRMFALCREFGFEVYPQYEEGENLAHIDGKTGRYGKYPNIGPFALVSLGLGFWQLDRILKRLPRDSAWTSEHAKALDAQSLGAWCSSPWNVPSATARKLLHTTMELLFSVPPDEVSLLGAMVLARGGGTFQYYIDATNTETHLIEGGSPALADRLAADLGEAVHLSSPVRRIEQTSAGVRVVSDRLTVEAKRVVVAVPPYLASKIDYDPPLPAEQMQLLRRMLSGSIIRGITVYDEPFWRKDGLNGMSVAPDLFAPVSIDQTPRSGAPGILSSYAFGPAATKASALDAEKRREMWLSSLAARFGPKALNPRAHMETDWAAQEWSLGGMIAHFAPGVFTTYGETLGKPAGRIHWAATEYAKEMHGLMEGAVRSGEAAADQAIRAEA